MEKRKIVYRDGNYQVLKPKDSGNFDDWYAYGKRKSLKGLSDLLEKGAFEFDIPEEIKADIESYRIQKRKFAIKTNLNN